MDGLKAMMSGRMQDTSFEIMDVYILVGLILLYYICVLIIIIYIFCKNDNSVMTSNDNPPSYDDVIELDELSCPSYNVFELGELSCPSYDEINA